jgi:hypothetical protein
VAQRLSRLAPDLDAGLPLSLWQALADTVLIELELGLTFIDVDLELIEQRRKQLATHLGAICGVDVLATRQSRGT